MNCYFTCVVNIQQIFYTVYVRLYSCSFYANFIKIRLVNPLLNNIEACIAYHRSWVVIPYKYLTTIFDLKHFWNNLCRAILHYYNDFYLIHLFCVQLRYAMFILIYNSLPFLSLPKMYVFILTFFVTLTLFFLKCLLLKWLTSILLKSTLQYIYCVYSEFQLKLIYSSVFSFYIKVFLLTQLLKVKWFQLFFIFGRYIFHNIRFPQFWTFW